MSEGRGETEPLRLTVRVYADEDPVLYHMLRNLPAQTRARQVRSILRQHIHTNSTPSSVQDRVPAEQGIPGNTKTTIVAKSAVPPVKKGPSALDDFDPASFFQSSTQVEAP